MRFCARLQAASLPLVVVLPVPFTPTRKVTLGGAAGVGDGTLRGFQNLLEAGLEQGAKFFAAFDGLAAGALAECVQNLGGRLHADVAGDERGFQFLQVAFVHRAGHGDDVFDLRSERFAGARNRLLHAVEEAGLLFLVLLLLGFFGFLEASKKADEFGHGVSFSLARRGAFPSSPGKRRRDGQPGSVADGFHKPSRIFHEPTRNVRPEFVQKPLEGNLQDREELASGFQRENGEFFPRLRLRKQREVA